MRRAYATDLNPSRSRGRDGVRFESASRDATTQSACWDSISAMRHGVWYDWRDSLPARRFRHVMLVEYMGIRKPYLILAY